MSKKKQQPSQSETISTEPTPTSELPIAINDLAGNPENGRAVLLRLQNSIGKQYKKQHALVLDSAPVAVLKRVPFGIVALDYRTGSIPWGRWIRLWGAKSSLKTTLCLRILRQAQTTCRHCKTKIVINPDTKKKDCQCPNPRYWLASNDDFQWLTSEAAIELSRGILPQGSTTEEAKDGSKKHFITCKPNVAMRAGSKPKDVELVEMFRCEPMRCLYVDSEGSITREWAVKNGVDPSLVVLVGAEWAEQCYATIEESVATREFDLIVIDSTSVLEPEAELAKSMDEKSKMAARAQTASRFVRRMLSLSYDDLTARYRPTVVLTSQVTTNISPTYTSLKATDGNAVEHALSIDIKLSEAGYTFDPTNQYAIYGDFDFEICKNRVGGGSPGTGGQIRFWLKDYEGHQVGDTEDVEIILQHARQFSDQNLVTERGSGYTVHSNYFDGNQKNFKTLTEVKDFLRDNPTVYDDLRDRVMNYIRESNHPFEVAKSSKQKRSEKEAKDKAPL